MSFLDKCDRKRDAGHGGGSKVQKAFSGRRASTETRKLECITRDRSWSEYFFEQGAGNGVTGTLWAAYNGVPEWMEHRKIRQNPDQRLASIWFGEANRIKARALTVAADILPHFRN